MWKGVNSTIRACPPAWPKATVDGSISFISREDGSVGVQMIEAGACCACCGRTLQPDIASYKVSLEALGAIMRHMMATTESTDTLVTTVRTPPSCALPLTGCLASGVRSTPCSNIVSEGARPV